MNFYNLSDLGQKKEAAKMRLQFRFLVVNVEGRLPVCLTESTNPLT